MADLEKNQVTSGSDEATGASRRPKWLGHLLVAGFVSCVVAVQLAVAMMFMSSASGSAKPDQESVEAQVEDAIDEENVVLDDSIVPVVEVELGEFTITAYRPSSEVTLRIDFRLYGTVTEDNESEFLNRYARSQNRIREQVIVTTRNAELTDLTDPGLGLIKRRILTKVNRTLGKPLLRTVIISEFSFLEQ